VVGFCPTGTAPYPGVSWLAVGTELAGNPFASRNAGVTPLLGETNDAESLKPRLAVMGVAMS
jgi:hypothetical protein